MAINSGSYQHNDLYREWVLTELTTYNRRNEQANYCLCFPNPRSLQTLGKWTLEFVIYANHNVQATADNMRHKWMK